MAGEGRTWSGNAVGGIKAVWNKLDYFPFKSVSFLSKHPLLPPKSRVCLLLQREKDSGHRLDIPPRSAGRWALGGHSAGVAMLAPCSATGKQGPREERGIRVLAGAAWRCAPATPGHRSRCWEHMP